MSVLWPGAMRWISIATSSSTQCSTAPKLDSLLSRTLRNYCSSSSIHRPRYPAIRSTRSIAPLEPPQTFIRSIRTARAHPPKRSQIHDKSNVPTPEYAKQPGKEFVLITEYQDLPEDYVDDEGLDYRSRPLTKTEVMQWFGPGVDPVYAHGLLQILHGRRVAGTLDDPTFQKFTHKKLTDDALAWLRKNVPVDEVQNAGQRAEAELAVMDDELVAFGEKVGIYKPNEAEPADTDLKNRSKRLGIYQSESDPAAYAPNAQPAKYYPESALDNIRRINDERAAAREAEEEARKKQEEEIKQMSGDLTVTPLHSKGELGQRVKHPWLEYYEKKADATAPDVLPIMSTWERLFPSGLVTLLAVASCTLFAMTYIPPNYRLFPELPPAAATLLTIVAINSFFLLAWRIPPLWVFMNKYMMVYPGYPRAAGIVGNIFSHQKMIHFATNMIVLWFVGTRLHDQIGRGDFVAIYLSSGFIGAYLSMVSYVLRGIFVTTHLGASGAVWGVVGAYCWVNRDQELPMVFFPEGMVSPLPKYSTLVLLAATAYMELRTIRRVNKGLQKALVDSYCHLAGLGTGLVGGEIARRRMEARQREKQLQGVLMMKNSKREVAV